MTKEPCARCGQRAAVDGPLCVPCKKEGPMDPDEAARWRERLNEDEETNQEEER